MQPHGSLHVLLCITGGSSPTKPAWHVGTRAQVTSTPAQAGLLLALDLAVGRAVGRAAQHANLGEWAKT